MHLLFTDLHMNEYINMVCRQDYLIIWKRKSEKRCRKIFVLIMQRFIYLIMKPWKKHLLSPKIVARSFRIPMVFITISIIFGQKGTKWSHVVSQEHWVGQKGGFQMIKNVRDGSSTNLTSNIKQIYAKWLTSGNK